MYNIKHDNNTRTNIYMLMYIYVFIQMNLNEFTAVLLIVMGLSLGLKH